MFVRIQGISRSLCMPWTPIVVWAPPMSLPPLISTARVPSIHVRKKPSFSPFGYLRMRRSRNCIVYKIARECDHVFWYILVCVLTSFSGPRCLPLRCTWAYSYGSRVDHHHLLRDGRAPGHMGHVEVAWTCCTSSLAYSSSQLLLVYCWDITTGLSYGYRSDSDPHVHDARYSAGHDQFVAGGLRSREHSAWCQILADHLAITCVHGCPAVA